MVASSSRAHVKLPWREVTTRVTVRPTPTLTAAGGGVRRSVASPSPCGALSLCPQHLRAPPTVEPVVMAQVCCVPVPKLVHPASPLPSSRLTEPLVTATTSRSGWFGFAPETLNSQVTDVVCEPLMMNDCGLEE